MGQEDRIVYVDKQSLFTGDYQLKNMPRPNLKDFNPHVRKSSGRQQPNPLKETSSTTNTDNLSTYKS